MLILTDSARDVSSAIWWVGGDIAKKAIFEEIYIELNFKRGGGKYFCIFYIGK
jgi:hypothetical protein